MVNAESSFVSGTFDCVTSDCLRERGFSNAFRAKEGLDESYSNVLGGTFPISAFLANILVSNTRFESFLLDIDCL